MMGTKERSFAPLIHVSLEDLVPADHFYRHLEQSLDLSFVREFVHQTYAGGGRPSIDPVGWNQLFVTPASCIQLCHNLIRLPLSWWR